jgi:cysteine desulfurase
LNTAKALRDDGLCELEFLSVDQDGLVDPDEVKTRLRPNTALVSVIYGNNEIGSVNPIRAIGKICRENGVLFHTDAVQASAHIPIDVEKMYIDLMSIGAHKFYGPKGIGVLFARRGIALASAITGGKQENGHRAGTSNVPYIVGLAEALKLVQTDSIPKASLLIEKRDRIIATVINTIQKTKLTGSKSYRLPNHASFVFEGVDGNLLLMLLDGNGYACSSGSACKVGNPTPSEILLAIGLSPRWAMGSLRVTIGKTTTDQEIDSLLSALPGLVEKARKKNVTFFDKDEVIATTMEKKKRAGLLSFFADFRK